MCEGCSQLSLGCCQRDITESAGPVRCMYASCHATGRVGCTSLCRLGSNDGGRCKVEGSHSKSSSSRRSRWISSGRLAIGEVGNPAIAAIVARRRSGLVPTAPSASSKHSSKMCTTGTGTVSESGDMCQTGRQVQLIQARTTGCANVVPTQSTRKRHDLLD